MNKLYLVRIPDKKDPRRLRIVGYIIINNIAAVKVVEAMTMEDIHAYMEDKNFTEFEWRIPKMQTFQLIKVKGW